MTIPPFNELESCVTDLSRPVAHRMRAIFYLRTLETDEAARVLGTALRNKEGTSLFRHELAYVLGQMQFESSVPVLTAVLSDVSDDPIVRHECAEALGAIGADESFEVLQEFVDDERSEVSETCQIAVRRWKWKHAKEDEGTIEVSAGDENPFQSVDPAPAAVSKSVDELQALLMNTDLPLFERYKAMFALRNQQTDASILALCTGLKDSSALFRHEVAYVLGQCAHPVSFDALKESLELADEHPMVRHEAAEALGAIGTPECVDLLQKYLKDGSVIVRESCEVALDVVDYWQELSTKPEGTSEDAAPAAVSQ